MQAEFEKEGLFPKRGKELNFRVNGKTRIIRGQLGEAAVIRVNGEEADIHTPIRRGDKIEVVPSTAGEAAVVELGDLNEFGDVIRVTVNEKRIDLPKFARVNGKLQSGYYDIKDNDEIEMLNYYTVRQIADFMDVMVDDRLHMYVNNRRADMETHVFENFAVSWAMKGTDEDTWLTNRERGEMAAERAEREKLTEYGAYAAMEEDAIDEEPEGTDQENRKKEEPADGGAVKAKEPPRTIHVLVNGSPVSMRGKPSYVFVDVFDYIEFDRSSPQGACVVTKRNGQISRYMERVEDGDVIEIYWEK